MATHFLQLFGEIDEHFIGMNGADRVNKATLDFGLFGAFQRGFDCNAKIANVVERIENAEDADTVRRGVLNEFFHDVVGIVIVAQKILPAQEHLNRRILKVRLELVEPFPGIFIQKSQATVEGRAAPRLKSFVADFVQTCKHRFHLTIAHTRRHQRLVPVAQDCFHDLKRFRHKVISPQKIF